MSKQEKCVSEFDGFEDWHLWACMVTKDNALVLNTVTEYYTNYQIPIKNDDFQKQTSKESWFKIGRCNEVRDKIKFIVYKRD